MSEYNNRCLVNIPYPPARTSGINKHYAALLSEAYAGQESEMTTLSVYSFQHFITADKYLADIIMCIARVEMKHFGFLGELISQYGGLPRIGVQYGRNARFWGGQYVNYETNPKVFIKNNIRGEEGAVRTYRRLIKQIDDERAIALFERLIIDEEHHIKIFNNLLQEV